MAAESEYAEAARQQIADLIVGMRRLCERAKVVPDDEVAYVLTNAKRFLDHSAYKLSDSGGYCPECNRWTVVRHWDSHDGGTSVTLGCGHTVGIPEFLSDLGKKKPTTKTQKEA